MKKILSLKTRIIILMIIPLILTAISIVIILSIIQKNFAYFIVDSYAGRVINQGISLESKLNSIPLLQQIGNSEKLKQLMLYWNNIKDNRDDSDDSLSYYEYKKQFISESSFAFIMGGLNTLLHAYEVSNAYVINDKSQYILTDRSLTTVRDFHKESWYMMLQNTNWYETLEDIENIPIFISDVHYSIFSKDVDNLNGDSVDMFVLTISVPIIDDEQERYKFLGSINVDIKLSSLQNLIERQAFFPQVDTEFINDDSFLFLLSGSNTVLYYPNIHNFISKKNILTSDSAQYFPKLHEVQAPAAEALNNRLREEARIGKRITKPIFFYENNRTMVIVYSNLLPDTGWRTAIAFDYEILVNRDMEFIRIAFIIMMLTMIIIASLVIGFVFISVLRPVLVTKQGLSELVNGEGDLSKRIAVRFDDEIGHVGVVVNSLISVLAHLMRDIKAVVLSLVASGERLKKKVHKTLQQTQNINQALQEVTSASNQQEEELSIAVKELYTVNLNIGELFQLIEQHNSSIESSFGSVEDMVSSINKMNGALEHNYDLLEQLVKASEIGQNTVKAVSKQIDSVVSQTSNLQEANTLIAGIAAKTNLLAMNAAIEAAHAGDAGKGFAVVANEIRRLAENSSAQSKAISENLSVIAKTVSEVAHSATDTRRAFDNIAQLIVDVDKDTQMISLSIDGQAKESIGILGKISDMRNLSNQIGQKVNDVQEIRQGLDETMLTLAEINATGNVHLAKVFSMINDINTDMNALSIVGQETLQKVQEIQESTNKFKL